MTEIDKPDFGKVTDLELAKEFLPAATGKTFAGEDVMLLIPDGAERLFVRFKLTKEEIAELLE